MSHYTCNGSPNGCERERFGQCGYCDRPHRNTPEFVLRYFVPCITFGIPYREELRRREREQAAAKAAITTPLQSPADLA